ncbi:MAG: hypothetical protein WDA22_00940 [Bacteroidota bacterium]
MKIPIFAHIASAFYLLPAVVGLIRWKNQNRYLKIFTIFCIYSVFHIIAEFILGRFGISNQELSNIYRLVQLECIFWLYYHWSQRPVVKQSLKVFAMLYLLFWITDFALHPFPHEFQESIATVANFLMLASSLIIIEHLFRTTHESMYSHSLFWIGTGIILYSAGTIVVLSMSNTILKMGIDYFILLWHINWGFTIIANLFFTRSFWCKIF